jgi:hypothetical protein
MKPKPGDFIISAALAVGMFLLSFLATGSLPPGFGFLKAPDPGRTALVSLDGTVISEISLDSAPEGYEYRVEKDGRLLSILVVRERKIRFTWSDCPDQVCVHTGWIGWSGQAAVCLPNRVMVRIQGNTEENGEDVDVYLR